MPIFDYRCGGCGLTFEALVDDNEDPCCPECGGEKVERQLSSPARVGVKKAGGGLQCGRTETCCGASEPCGKPACGK